MRMLADDPSAKSEINPIIEAIPFKSFKEKIRLVKTLLKIGKVEIDTDLNIILVMERVKSTGK